MSNINNKIKMIIIIFWCDSRIYLFAYIAMYPCVRSIGKRNPGSGTPNALMSFIFTPQPPIEEWWRRAPGTVLSSGTSVHRVGSYSTCIFRYKKTPVTVVLANIASNISLLLLRHQTTSNNFREILHCCAIFLT